MISNRTISLTLSGATCVRRITRGCPQGGVLSPFLWNLTLNGLLSSADLDPDLRQAFADDISIIILIGGFCISTIRSKCQLFLDRINSWCSSVGLNISVLKTQAIMFTWKRKIWELDCRQASQTQQHTHHPSEGG